MLFRSDIDSSLNGPLSHKGVHIDSDLASRRIRTRTHTSPHKKRSHINRLDSHTQTHTCASLSRGFPDIVSIHFTVLMISFPGTIRLSQTSQSRSTLTAQANRSTRETLSETPTCYYKGQMSMLSSRRLPASRRWPSSSLASWLTTSGSWWKACTSRPCWPSPSSPRRSISGGTLSSAGVGVSRSLSVSVPVGVSLSLSVPVSPSLSHSLCLGLVYICLSLSISVSLSVSLCVCFCLSFPVSLVISVSFFLALCFTPVVYVAGLPALILMVWVLTRNFYDNRG